MLYDTAIPFPLMNRRTRWPAYALVIVFLIPLALKGVAYRAVGAAALLRRNVLIYGVGGLIVPFVGIKAIDLLLSAVHLA